MRPGAAGCGVQVFARVFCERVRTFQTADSFFIGRRSVCAYFKRFLHLRVFLSQGFGLLRAWPQRVRDFAQTLAATGGDPVSGTEGFALLSKCSPAAAKGSQFWKKFAEGSHFWAQLCQKLERVRTFNDNSQTVRTFGHCWPKLRKGSHS